MAYTTSTVLAAATIASLVATAAGTGLSMYGQQQQAQNAASIANYNAQIQRQNANIQARMSINQANTNARIAQAQYQQGQNNAITLRNQATAQEAQGRERARRLREEQDRALSTRRAKYAASGVVNEGSPLAVLADTARLTELNIQDAAHQTELERQQSLHQAELEQFQSGFSLIDAQTESYKAMAADSARRIAYREADLTKLSGQSQAQGYQIGATSSLISGLGQMAGTAQNYFYNAKPGVDRTTIPGGTYNPYAPIRRARAV